jgi:hypothetical protein
MSETSNMGIIFGFCKHSMGRFNIHILHWDNGVFYTTTEMV